MFKLVREPDQSVHERNFHRHIKVVPVPPEDLVLALLEDEDEVSCGVADLLVRNVFEGNGLAVSHALLDVDRYASLLGHGLTIRAFEAIGLPHFTPADALLVPDLNLLDEARGELLAAYFYSRALAVLRSLRALLPVQAHDFTDVVYFENFAQVQLLEGHLEGKLNVGGPAFPVRALLIPEAAEAELLENISKASAPTLPSSCLLLLQAVLPVPVIRVPLLLVAEHFVSPRDL
mmetsp:Transcript_22563/g.42407  ORF Transcript_22563/g.42407 Transcript_22563/m.42407 type:complete len:233 (-) Transcript_22563:182-880(-)